MRTGYGRTGFLGALGIVLLLGLGCGTKTIQTGATSQAFQPPAKPTGPAVETVSASSLAQPGLSEQDLTGRAAISETSSETSGSETASGTSGQKDAMAPMAEEPSSPFMSSSETSSGTSGQKDAMTESSLTKDGATSPSQAGEPSSAFPPLTMEKGSAGDRGSGEIVVAKAEPSEAVRRQLEQMQREQAVTALAGLNDVYFGFDSWKLADEARKALDVDAGWLKANPNKSLTIEGYCDERGTVAYNLVLGEKRAKAVREYLIEHGIAAERLSVVSYGKERPFCREHDEACYQQNRRAHLVVRAQ